jgi:hypothetical protein
MIWKTPKGIPKIKSGATLRQVCEEFFLTQNRSKQEEKAQLKPLRSLIATGVWIATGYLPGEHTPVRIPPPLRHLGTVLANGVQKANRRPIWKD